MTPTASSSTNSSAMSQAVVRVLDHSTKPIDEQHGEGSSNRPPSSYVREAPASVDLRSRAKIGAPSLAGNTATARDNLRAHDSPAHRTG